MHAARARSHTDAGFTLIEILIVVTVIGLLAAMAAPSLQRARMVANESSAIGSLRTIVNAQQSFWSSCGNGMYARSLQALGKRMGGQPGFLSPDLSGAAPVAKSGYGFDLSGGTVSTITSCHGEATLVGYHATADPNVGQGRRHFGVNGSGTIFQSTGTLLGVIGDSGAPPAPAVPVASY